MKWAYGVSTVPSRRDGLLTRTLVSLRSAGFPEPRLFVDGHIDAILYVDQFGLETTAHYPKVGNFGNWVLGLTELYLRDPKADRYAMFEDDVVLCRNVKEYLEACPFSNKGYINLYTVEDAVKQAPATPGWVLSTQGGRGALGLVFDQESVKALLSSLRCVSHAEDRLRGHYLVDGAVVDSMERTGRKEWVHWPSLAQHTGTGGTTIENRLAPTLQKFNEAPSFPGEDFDAMSLLIGGGK